MFASEAYSTGHRHYFPYPAKSETNLQAFIENTLKTTPYNNVDGIDYGPSVTSFIITRKNTSGQELNCIAKPGPATKKFYNESGEGSAFYESFVLDDIVFFEEQATYLFPRAVAYSKVLLDYFFRGTIK